MLLRVEEKFRLDLNGKHHRSISLSHLIVNPNSNLDEQAEQFFIGMINETLHAIAPRVMEQLHKIAVSLR